MLADWSQRWIDRNFPLDYTLKSLEKILDGPGYHAVRDLRRVLKNAAYLVFGAMLHTLNATDPDTAARHPLHERCAAIVESMIRELHAALDPVVARVQADLPDDHRDLLHHEYDRWNDIHTWDLINAGDPCGT
ncbi:hypothetical protein GCM10022243_43150 [Saccharothrix violaceirubra]|uniref:Uncharacterized protein n=1 Tax=Saccharothrix violaceirubra TaxID=413306 RepID=A0A7W7T2Z1_9PSEU|nr:hypothetical protein [Saccharothrix violaceirubra]MBB4965603.1 hypothetical protein [Saccharothrix violaceirubra]